MGVLKYTFVIYTVIQVLVVAMWYLGWIHWELYIIFMPTWSALLVVGILFMAILTMLTIKSIQLLRRIWVKKFTL